MLTLRIKDEHWINNHFEVKTRVRMPTSYNYKKKFSPVQSSPVQSIPVQSSPVQSSPVQSSPVQSSPVQSSPVQSSPVQSSPVQSSPVQSSPVQSSPVQSSPVQSSPVQSLVQSPVHVFQLALSTNVNCPYQLPYNHMKTTSLHLQTNTSNLLG